MSGSVEHVPGIGRCTFSAVENSKESGAKMYMRADVEIFLKGTVGQDTDEGKRRGGGYGDCGGGRWGRSRKSLAKGATPRARFLEQKREREREIEVWLIVCAVG